MQPTEPTLPLSGVKVLDLSRLLPGPFASLVLADLGAQVDKVEDANGGDYLRHMPPQRHGESTLFAALNRNKRSIVLDLKKPEGKDAFCKLLSSYDILIDSFRPGVLARLGLAYPSLRAQHPRLIVCAMSGYGQTGPLAQRAGHDLNYLARGGVLGSQGPTGSPPQVPGTQTADIGGALFACIGILAALRERDATGRGKVLDISLMESAMPFAIASFAATFGEQTPSAGDDALTGGIAPYSTYETRDGLFVTLAALEPKFWLAFTAAVGLAADIGDMLPGPHQRELKEKLHLIFRGRSRAEWIAFAAAIEVCIEPVLTLAEAMIDAQIQERGLFFDIESSGSSEKHLKLPTTPARVHQRAPSQGEHTDVILSEAGFDDAALTELRLAAAIR